MIKKQPDKSDVLVDYVRKNLAKGYSMESLKWALIKQGNSRLEIEKAIKKVEEELADASAKAKARASMESINQPAEVVPVQEESKSLWRKLFG